MKKTKNSYKKSGVNIETADKFTKYIAKYSKQAFQTDSTTCWSIAFTWGHLGGLFCIILVSLFSARQKKVGFFVLKLKFPKIKKV